MPSTLSCRQEIRWTRQYREAMPLCFDALIPLRSSNPYCLCETFNTVVSPLLPFPYLPQTVAGDVGGGETEEVFEADEDALLTFVAYNPTFDALELTVCYLDHLVALELDVFATRVNVVAIAVANHGGTDEIGHLGVRDFHRRILAELVGTAMVVLI